MPNIAILFGFFSAEPQNSCQIGEGGPGSEQLAYHIAKSCCRPMMADLRKGRHKLSIEGVAVAQMVLPLMYEILHGSVFAADRNFAKSIIPSGLTLTDRPCDPIMPVYAPFDWTGSLTSSKKFIENGRPRVFLDGSKRIHGFSKKDFAKGCLVENNGNVTYRLHGSHIDSASNNAIRDGILLGDFVGRMDRSGNIISGAFRNNFLFEAGHPVRKVQDILLTQPLDRFLSKSVGFIGAPELVFYNHWAVSSRLKMDGWFR